MKRNIGNGKTVQKLEWIGANKVIVTYNDFSKEEMTRIIYDQMIKQVRK